MRRAETTRRHVGDECPSDYNIGLLGAITRGNSFKVVKTLLDLLALIGYRVEKDESLVKSDPIFQTFMISDDQV
jgi:hypothetical protein